MLANRMARFRCASILTIVAGLIALPFGYAGPASAEREKASPSSGGAVDFERHLVGLFGRMGCNSGSCHGSFQGRGGLRLSLFGYDPEKDYLALTRDNFGRRVDPVDPDHSLLLLKPTGQLEHGGGLRFA